MKAKATSPEEKRFLRLDHAAALYDISARTLRTMCLLGKIKATKIGERWYLEPGEMQRLVAEGQNSPWVDRRGRRGV